MIRRTLFILLLLLLALPAQAQSSLDERGYGVYVPRSYRGEALPLVIALHGAGDDYTNFARATGLVPIAEQHQFVAAFPNAYLREWNDGSAGRHYEDDVALLLELIEVIAGEINIDRERIYLLGFSNGGTMTFRAACDAPGTFAAVAAIAGSMRRVQACDAAAHTAVMLIHGTDDGVVPFDGGAGRLSAPATAQRWVELNACTDEDVPEYDPEQFERGIGIWFYDECANGDLVLLYALERFGHVYPGAIERASGIPAPLWMDASLLAWNFFQLATLRQQQAAPAITPEATADS